MELFSNLSVSLFSPMVLAFALGIVVTLLRSDLKFPDGLYLTLTIYLLFAIGLKGGYKLSIATLSEVWKPGLAALGLGLLIPVWCYFILRKCGRFDISNAAAVAAHYGSVSAVTFGAGLTFLDVLHVPYEGFLPALLAIMEVPGIVAAIFLARLALGGKELKQGKLFHELLTGKGIILLVGGLLIGLISGKKGFEQVAPLFDAPFRGVLTLFLLEIGMMTGQRLHDLRKAGLFLVGFGVIMPLLHGLLGVWVGQWVGLSCGGSTILAILAASASYIAAPAAVRIALPEASPAYYLTASLAVTFPFNIVVGIPLYYHFAQWLFRV